MMAFVEWILVKFASDPSRDREGADSIVAAKAQPACLRARLGSNLTITVE